MTYLLTFTCYGPRLHGDESGSVDRRHHIPGTRLLEPDSLLHTLEQKSMSQPPYELDARRRPVVLKSLQEVCRFRGWILLAAHVRCTHVHVVIEGETAPEPMLNTLKSYASRALNNSGLDPPDRRRWARHGSTRYLWNRDQVRDAAVYVLDKQGEPLEVFKAPLPDGRGSEGGAPETVGPRTSVRQ